MTRQEIGGFELTHLLGRGGMGEVWAAVHRASGDEVAVKLVGQHRRAAEALLNEVRAAATLDHPGWLSPPRPAPSRARTSPGTCAAGRRR